MRKALPVLAICLFNGVLTPLPSAPKRGKGQKSPLSLLSSDLEASKKKAPESLSHLLLKIYWLQKWKSCSRILTWLFQLQIFASWAREGENCWPSKDCNCEHQGKAISQTFYKYCMENLLTRIYLTALAVIISELRPFSHELKDRIAGVAAATDAHPLSPDTEMDVNCSLNNHSLLWGSLNAKMSTGFYFLQDQLRLLAAQGRKSKQVKVHFPIFNTYCFSFLAL